MRIPLKDMILENRKTFIGEYRLGAKLELKNQLNFYILRETTRSQLILILSLAAICLTPLVILVFVNEQINGGLLGKAVLSLATLVSFPFLLKYAFRFFGRRRIEIDISKQTICFISEKSKIERSLSFSEIKTLKIEESFLRHDGLAKKVFTLVLQDASGELSSVCSTDNKRNMVQINEGLLKILGQNLN